MITEDLSSQVDGSAVTFTTGVSFAPGTLRVYLDGIRQQAGVSDDYVEASTTSFTMAESVDLGSVLLVDYDLVGDGLVTASGT